MLRIKCYCPYFNPSSVFLINDSCIVKNLQNGYLELKWTTLNISTIFKNVVCFGKVI